MLKSWGKYLTIVSIAVRHVVLVGILMSRLVEPLCANEQAGDKADPLLRGLGGTKLDSVTSGLKRLEGRLDDLDQEAGTLPDVKPVISNLALELEAKTDELEELQARITNLKGVLNTLDDVPKDLTVAELRKQVEKLRRRLETMLKKVGEEANRTDKKQLADIRAEIDNKRRELKRLQTKIENLKNALMETGRNSTDTSLEDLTNRQQQLQDTIAELRKQKKALEDRIGNMLVEDGKTAESHARLGRGRVSEKEDHVIVLVNNRVVPVEEPFFEFQWNTLTRGQWVYKYVSKATRVKDGQPVKQALSEGGIITELLAENEPDSDRLKLLVCPDSVKAFRRIVTAAKKKGFEFFWLPHDDTPIKGGPGGGGTGIGM